MTLSDRVYAGIAWLDQNAPADWRERINLDILDINSTTLCVAGQVLAEQDTRGYGGYNVLADKYGINLWGRRDLGFTATGGPESMDELQAEWVRALTPVAA